MKTSNKIRFFKVSKYLFHIKTKDQLYLPRYKGSIFRGAFSNSMKRNICVKQKAICDACDLTSQCPCAYIFAPSPPENFKDAGKFRKPPAPYILNPPLTEATHFANNEKLCFELVLVEKAINFLPYIVFSFMQIGRNGLGKSNGKFELKNVDLVENGIRRTVFDGSMFIPIKPEVAEDGEMFLENEIKEPGKIKIEFVSPLRLKEKGTLVTRFDFPLFMERIIHRVKLLSDFYGDGFDDSFGASLMEKAREIKVSKDNLRWYDWERYSTRQKTTMKFGGLKGFVVVEGSLCALLPLLKTGEMVNVGQGTTFGLGNFETSII